MSYATEDREAVEPVVTRLANEGFSAWYDQHILPGQRWKLEIETNQREADIVLVFMSSHSVSKRGFVQREAVAALSKLDEMLPDDIYLIPIMLGDCDPPQQIKDRIQFIDIRRPDFWDRLFASLRLAASQRGIQLPGATTHGPFQIRTHIITDEVSGPDGYQTQFEYPEFASNQYTDAAKELTDFFRARAHQKLISARKFAWRNPPGSEPWSLGSTRSDSYSVHACTDDMVSIVYTIDSYYSGAAHGNHGFEVYNFRIGDKLTPFSFEDLFDHDGLKLVSSICVEKLKQQYWERTGEEADLDIVNGWFARGAGPDWLNYKLVAFGPDGITCLFPPYQVYAYVLGSWAIDVSHYELRATARDTWYAAIFEHKRL